MAYLTGSSRTVVLRLSVSGDWKRQRHVLLPSEEPYGGAAADMAAGAFGCSVSITPFSENVDPGTGLEEHMGVEVTCTTPYGSTDQKLYDVIPIPGTLGHDYSWSGYVEFAVELQQTIEESLVGSSPYWRFSVPDSPFETKELMEDTHKPGGQIRATAVITDANGTHTVEQSDTIATRTSETFGVSASINGPAGEATAGQGGTGNWTWGAPVPQGTGDDVAGLDYPSPSYNYTETVSTAGGNVTAELSSFCQVELTSKRWFVPDPGGLPTGTWFSAPADGEMSTVVYPTKTIDVTGVFRAMDAAYPDSLTARVTGIGAPTGYVDGSGSGTWSVSGTQEAYSVSGTAMGVDEPDLSKSEWEDVEASITTASLSAAGESTLLQRILFRGKQYGGMSVSLADSVNLSSVLSPTIDNSTPGQSSLDWGGELVSLRPYAYADIKFRVVGAADVDLTLHLVPPGTSDLTTAAWKDYLGGAAGDTQTDEYSGDATPTKTWTLNSGPTDGAWVTVRIDLLKPENVSDTTDDQDTLMTEPPRSPRYYGVPLLESVLLDGGGSNTVEFDATAPITLVREETRDEKADYLPTFYAVTQSGTVLSGPWGVSARPTEGFDDSVTTIEYRARRFLQGFVDGHAGIEEYDLYLTQTTTEVATTLNWSLQTIQGLVDRLNGTQGLSSGDYGDVRRYPGVTATVTTPVPGSGCSPTPPALPPASDCLYNAARPAVELWGAGALVDHDTDTWTYGLLIDLGGGEAQVLFDVWSGHPGAKGAQGGYDDTQTLRGAAILRGDAQGVVFDDAGARSSGVTVRLRQTSDSSDRGSDATDADGWYVTGLPFGKGGLAHNVIAESGDNPNVSIGDLLSRHRHRAFFGVAVGGIWLSADISDTLRAARAEVKGGTIHLGFAALPDGSLWSDTDTGIEGARPCLRYRRADRQGGILLVYESDPGGGSLDILRRVTNDEGGSFSVATTVFSGGYQFPCVAISPTGMEHHFAIRDSDSAVRGKVMDPQGNTAIAEFTAVAGAVDADAIAAYERFGFIYLLYRDGGAIQTVRSSDLTTFA